MNNSLRFCFQPHKRIIDVLKITILLSGTYLPTHFCTHAAAVIKDEQRQETFVIEYDGFEMNTKQLRHDINSYYGYVDLYSDKSFSDFQNAYNKEFKPGGYHCLDNNCADAVNFMLDYFFPDKRAQCWYKAKQMLCCLPGIAFFGASCVPPPLMISSPLDVFSRAKSIAETAEQKKLSASFSKSVIKEYTASERIEVVDIAPCAAPSMHL